MTIIVMRVNDDDGNDNYGDHDQCGDDIRIMMIIIITSRVY